MNPFSFFHRFASANLEKNLTDFLVNNRLFQLFAHRSSQKAEEIARKLANEIDRAAGQSAQKTTSNKKIQK